MNLILINKISRSSDVSSFYFKPQSPITWEAGQFMYFTLPHSNPDDRGISRYFTISSAPYEENIMITTRFVSEGSSSFKNALLNMEIGQNISALPPKGEFVIGDLLKSYVLIAGGIGITPFRSIILDLNYRKKLQSTGIYLLYSNRNNEVVFKDEFDSLAEKNSSFKLRYIINPERCNTDLIKNTIADYAEKIYYISGPVKMVKAIEDMLASIGLTEDKVKQDYFPGY
jgi:ferredoxin-NADP reductase